MKKENNLFSIDSTSRTLSVSRQMDGKSGTKEFTINA